MENFYCKKISQKQQRNGKKNKKEIKYYTYLYD